MATHIWLRSETKPFEERTALDPQAASELLAAGFRLTVEKSSQSCFGWQEYQAVGCEIADEHSWYKTAPQDAIILGLKELPSSELPLTRRHIHFAHVYKEQSGWDQFLGRFGGDGKLYDLEFLVDEQGKRVAAFGHWAGFAGAALAIMAWCSHRNGDDHIMKSLRSRGSQQELVEELAAALQNINEKPRAMVIGSLGRCGRGAIELLDCLDITMTGWDIEETSTGGPFKEIMDYDVLLNCVFVNQLIPPFLTNREVADSNRKLSVISDISCDPYGTYNPLPIYEHCTTFDQPIHVLAAGSNPLYLIAIDHLPSLLPRESSKDFCNQLLPYLRQLNNLEQGVWQRASELFSSKLRSIKPTQ